VNLNLPQQEIETAWEEGRRMSVEQAIAYARESAREEPPESGKTWDANG
jgi:hypothetical protein